MAVKEVTPGSGTFSAAYGVYFPGSIIGTPNASYSLFADLNNNGQYDDGSAAIVENFSLRNNFSISNFCATEGNGVMQCASACPSPLPTGAISCASNALSWLAVTFKRPDPNAIILTSALSSLPSVYSNAIITASSQAGVTRSVSISSVGQIIINSQ